LEIIALLVAVATTVAIMQIVRRAQRGKIADAIGYLAVPVLCAVCWAVTAVSLLPFGPGIEVLVVLAAPVAAGIGWIVLCRSRGWHF
jgi:hypothetical protein